MHPLHPPMIQLIHKQTKFCRNPASQSTLSIHHPPPTSTTAAWGVNLNTNPSETSPWISLSIALHRLRVCHVRTNRSLEQYALSFCTPNPRNRHITGFKVKLTETRACVCLCVGVCVLCVLHVQSIYDDGDKQRSYDTAHQKSTEEQIFHKCRRYGVDQQRDQCQYSLRSSALTALQGTESLSALTLLGAFGGA